MHWRGHVSCPRALYPSLLIACFSATRVSPALPDSARPLGERFFPYLMSEPSALRGVSGSCREQPLLPIYRENACLHLSLFSPHRRQSAHGNYHVFHAIREHLLLRL